jgi:hypothetical protein
MWTEWFYQRLLCWTAVSWMSPRCSCGGKQPWAGCLPTAYVGVNSCELDFSPLRLWGSTAVNWMSPHCGCGGKQLWTEWFYLRLPGWTAVSWMSPRCGCGGKQLWAGCSPPCSCGVNSCELDRCPPDPAAAGGKQQWGDDVTSTGRPAQAIQWKSTIGVAFACRNRFAETSISNTDACLHRFWHHSHVASVHHSESY